MAKQLLDILLERFGSDVIVATHSELGDDTACVKASYWLEVASFLRDDPRCAMQMLVDLCGVDHFEDAQRLEVVAHLYSLTLGHRIRIKSRVGDDECDNASIDSLVSVWTGANWFEREAYDMFGIHFEGHPDLRRILLYEEFEGHPLRKDYPAEKTQPLVQYRQEATGKLPPFGEDEGMVFGRKHLDYRKQQD